MITYAGPHTDENGTFEVFYYPNSNDRRLDVLEDCEAGWYWATAQDMGNVMGPYTSSQEAWQAATDLDFSINHH